MITKTNKLADFQLTQNDVIIDVVSHESVNMFHCCLPEKYKLKNGGNHLLHENIIVFYDAVMDATKGKAKYNFFDEELADLFWYAGDVYKKHVAGKTIEDLSAASRVKLLLLNENADKHLKETKNLTSEQLELRKIA